MFIVVKDKIRYLVWKNIVNMIIISPHMKDHVIQSLCVKIQMYWMQTIEVEFGKINFVQQ
jgi:hypothetical protein